LEGFGKQKAKSGDIPGDLVIVVRIENDMFERDGDALVFRPKISFIDSVVGFPLVVNHYGGTFICDTRRFGPIDPRKYYEIPGKGLKDTTPMKVQFDVQYTGVLSKDDLESLQLKIRSM
jgi:DnaJ-class molecular chaperone